MEYIIINVLTNNGAFQAKERDGVYLSNISLFALHLPLFPQEEIPTRLVFSYTHYQSLQSSHTHAPLSSVTHTVKDKHTKLIRPYSHYERWRV
jgi:hypothetical protein